jgi:hypothetical protein
MPASGKRTTRVPSSVERVHDRDGDVTEVYEHRGFSQPTAMGMAVKPHDGTLVDNEMATMAVEKLGR